MQLQQDGEQSIEHMINDGSIQPIVQIIAPGSPDNFVPTNVAALIDIEPGVISAIVIRSVNSDIVINL